MATATVCRASSSGAHTKLRVDAESFGTGRLLIIYGLNRPLALAGCARLAIKTVVAANPQLVIRAWSLSYFFQKMPSAASENFRTTDS